MRMYLERFELLESIIITYMHIQIDTLYFPLYIACLTKRESVKLKRCVIPLLPLFLRSKPFLPHGASPASPWPVLTACHWKGALRFPQLASSHFKPSMGVTRCSPQGRPQTAFKWTPSNPSCVSSSPQIALVFNCGSHVCFRENWTHMLVTYLDWAHHIVVFQAELIVQEESPRASSYTAPCLSASLRQEVFSALQNPLSRL